MSKPQPETFVFASYVLAIVSSIVIALALAAGFLPDSIATLAQQVFWLAMLTSGTGAFMAYAARADLRHQSIPALLARRLSIGWRFNLVIFIIMVVVALVIIIDKFRAILN